MIVDRLFDLFHGVLDLLLLMVTEHPIPGFRLGAKRWIQCERRHVTVPVCRGQQGIVHRTNGTETRTGLMVDKQQQGQDQNGHNQRGRN